MEAKRILNQGLGGGNGKAGSIMQAIPTYATISFGIIGMAKPPKHKMAAVSLEPDINAKSAKKIIIRDMDAPMPLSAAHTTVIQ